jgi:lysophospholipase L1-like esterase
MRIDRALARVTVPAFAASLVCCVAIGCGAESAATDDRGGTGGASATGGGSGGTSATGGAVGTGGVGAGGLGTTGGAGGTAGTGGVVATGGTGGSAATGGHAGGASGAGGGAGAAGHAGGGAAGGRAGTGGSASGAGGAGGGRAGSGGAATGGAAGQAGAAGAGGAASLPNVTIWIAGDSTVMTYPEPNTDGDNMVSLYGWGQEIGQFLNSKVTINNQAIGGRSVAFFMWSVVTDSAGNYQCVDDQGTPEFQMNNGNKVNTSQWSHILNGMKAGDFLLIQFGTNDETHTCPRYVSLPDFETDFGIMADAAAAKGATPIFVTPMGHRTFSGATASNTLLPYANAMKDEANQKMVEVEDLNLESEAYYTSVGNTSFLASTIFDGGTTHFTQAGATEMASLIVTEVRKNKGRLAGYLK